MKHTAEIEHRYATATRCPRRIVSITSPFGERTVRSAERPASSVPTWESSPVMRAGFLVASAAASPNSIPVNRAKFDGAIHGQRAARQRVFTDDALAVLHSNIKLPEPVISIRHAGGAHCIGHQN